MTIYQYKNAFRYNCDSIVLCKFIKDNANDKTKKALDIGCGSGVLGLFLAKNFTFDVDSVDIGFENVFLASFNFYANGFLKKHILNDLKNTNLWALDDELPPKQSKFFDDFKQSKFFNTYRFFCGDFSNFSLKEYEINSFKSIAVNSNDLYQKYDLIVSNPPFYNTHQNSSNPHQNISKNAHFMPLDKFIKNTYKLLKPKGDFIFCYESSCFDNVVYELVKNKFSIEKIQFFSTTKAKNPRLMCIKARKCIKTKNTILSTQSYDDSDFMDLVYKTTCFNGVDFCFDINKVLSLRDSL